MLLDAREEEPPDGQHHHEEEGEQRDRKCDRPGIERKTLGAFSPVRGIGDANQSKR